MIDTSTQFPVDCQIYRMFLGHFPKLSWGCYSLRLYGGIGLCYENADAFTRIHTQIAEFSSDMSHNQLQGILRSFFSYSVKHVSARCSAKECCIDDLSQSDP